MIPTARRWLNVLQIGLILSAIGWGISFSFTFTSWSTASNQLYDMGAKHIADDPLLDYWLKMASSVFGCIGLASALACFKPQTFAGLIALLGPFHFFVGTVLAVTACRNGLNPKAHPSFIPDITFCFLTGLLIQLPLLCGRQRSSGASQV